MKHRRLFRKMFYNNVFTLHIMESDDIIKSMNYYHANTSTVVQNTDFRHVVYTAKNIQVVFMSVLACEEIGEEVHDEHDQLFFFGGGKGKFIMGRKKKQNFGHVH